MPIRSPAIVAVLALISVRAVAGQASTWPPECRQLPARVAVPEQLPERLAQLDPWLERLSRAVTAAEPDFVTPLDPVPPQGHAAVRDLWKEDPLAVEWALAKLTADGAWEGRWPGQMYGRYYEAFSGRAGPVLYYLFASEAPHWEWALFAVKPPLTAAEEQVLFWHTCMALWPAVAMQADSSGAMVEEAFPPWLALAHRVVTRSFPLLTPIHRQAIRRTLSPYLRNALGLPRQD